MAALVHGPRAIRRRRRYKPYYSKRELANLNQTKDYVMGELLDKKGSLYKLYFDQSVSDLQ